MTRFSIILPCHNAAETLDSTLTSLLGQTCSDWELICVDDGSTDETFARLKDWATRDARIRVLHQDNQGPSAARNHGAGRARGDILCFCDADDLWTASKLADLDAVFQDPQIGGAFGKIAFFQTPGRADTFSTVPMTALTIPHLLGENPVCTMSNIAVRHSVFETCGGFAEGLVHNEDLEWLIRLVGMGTVLQPINKLHVWYRASSGGLSADLFRMAHSRRLALSTAVKFGHAPSRANEATYLRYLARRALRLDHGRAIALRLTLEGLAQSPAGFLFPLRRGLATALAACLSALLPRAIQRFVFAK